MRPQNRNKVRYVKAYEQSLRRLLAEHVEAGIPLDTDIWPLVQRRLEQSPVSREVRDRRNPGKVARHIKAGISGVFVKVGGLYRPVRLVAGLCLFLLLAGVTLYTISRFASRPVAGTPATTEATLLFSTPFGEDRMGPGILPSITGFGVANDGSYWVSITGEQLLHLSPTGQLLAMLHLPMQYVTDLEVQGSYLWVLTGNTVYKLAFDGTVIGEYYPVMQFPGLSSQPIHLHNMRLQVAPNGQMLLEQEDNARAYLLADSTADPANSSSMTPIAGYPVGAQSYREGPQGNVIMAGDVPVTIDLPPVVVGWHIFLVLPDGSFYVLVINVVEEGPQFEKRTYNYVMHYTSGGKLLERARVPTVGYEHCALNCPTPKQLAVGPDNGFYLVTLNNFDLYSSHAQVDVSELNFFPANDPLPPVPTSTPTPIVPTPVPTLPGMIMPVTTGQPSELPTPSTEVKP